MIMDFGLPILLVVCALFFLVAFLYSTVGHGGASGYLAVLSLFAFTPNEMSTTALLLNIVVAGIAFSSYARSGHFSPRLVMPFLLGSIPFAFVGGSIRVSPSVYGILLAAALLFAAFRLFGEFKQPVSGSIDRESPSMLVGVPVGACIGLLSGIVGVGGGIFLSPLILLAGWADARRTSAVSACFIVLNSIAAILARGVQGNFSLGNVFPFMIAAVLGGMIGSSWGAKKLSNRVLRRLLAAVLVIAAGKLVLNALKS